MTGFPKASLEHKFETKAVCLPRARAPLRNMKTELSGRTRVMKES